MCFGFVRVCESECVAVIVVVVLACLARQGKLSRGEPGDHLLLHEAVLPKLRRQGDDVNACQGVGGGYR